MGLPYFSRFACQVCLYDCICHYTKITVVRPSVCESSRSLEVKSFVCLQSLSLTLHLVVHWHGQQRHYFPTKLSILEVCVTKRRSTNVLTSGSLETTMFGIRDCPCVLCRGRQFCSRCLMPGVHVSKAARWITNFLASWLNESHYLPECARVRSCMSWPHCATTWPILYYTDPRLVTTAQSLMWI